jgi:hypothetical protein
MALPILVELAGPEDPACQIGRVRLRVTVPAEGIEPLHGYRSADFMSEDSQLFSGWQGYAGI